jgi:hypothetical protein
MLMDIMQHLTSKETTQEVWDTIKTLQLGHLHVRAASLQTMMKAYENLQMCDDEFVEQFTARVVPLVMEFSHLARSSRRFWSCGVSSEQRLHSTYL